MDVRLPSPSSNSGDNIRLAYEAATLGTTHSRRTADVGFALPRSWDPSKRGMSGAYSLATGMGNLTEFDSDDNVRKSILQACRNIAKTHPVVSAAVNVYSRYPLQGIRLEHADADMERFYTDLFLEDLDFENFLIDVGKVFWVDGSAYIYGDWSDELGLWVGEDMFDPLDITVEHIPFSGEDFIYYTPNDDIKSFVRQNTPDGYRFRQMYPDIWQAIVTGQPVPVSQDRCIVLANKDRLSENYGTPIMTRAWDTLRLESRMHDAMQATADRLYAPLLLFTVGGTLPNGAQYIPSAAALDAFRSNLDAALASNFRAVVTHQGVDCKEVIRTNTMSAFKQDIDMYDERILMAYGLSTSIFKPQGGTYATSALEFQLAAQILTSYQTMLATVYNRQAAFVAEAQGHYARDEDGNVIYEAREVWDPDVETETGETGAMVVVKTPKLDYPAIKFDVVNFKDEQEERKFRMELKKEGMPISDEDLAIGVDIDLKATEERFNDEQIHKKVEEARRNLAIFDALNEQNLPIPPDVAKYFREAIPPEAVRDAVDQFADRIDSSSAGYADLQTDSNGDSMSGAGGSSNAVEDVTVEDEVEDNTEVRQRPPVSDEQRGDMPKQ